MNTPLSATRGHGAAIVVVAHPGHKVRIHGWLERERPQVFILTDGSRHAGRPRIASTGRYLLKFGLRPAPVFGRLTDLEAETRQDFEGRGRDEDKSEHFKLAGDEHAATPLSGLDVFRVECLRPVSDEDPPFDAAVPFYERHGERRVTGGLYEHVIRYREHVAPLADALREHTERRT